MKLDARVGAQSPMQTSTLPPPSSRDSSRHCQSLPRWSSHSCVVVHRWRQIPLLREIQAKPSRQSASLSHATVQIPPGKLPPVSHRPDSQSSATAQDSPGAPASVAQPTIVSKTVKPIIKCRIILFPPLWELLPVPLVENHKKQPNIKIEGVIREVNTPC